MLRTRLAQIALGVLATLFVYFPYVRRVHGRIPKGRRLFVCNHVSLLDTLILGACLFLRGHAPILVLGDRGTWRKTRLRALLSRSVGFLIDRGAPDKAMVDRLSDFGSRIDRFDLIVFPEGTRGDGKTVAPCQPGIRFIARAANTSIVPVFLEGVERVTSKNGPRHLIRGLRKIEVHFGEEFSLGDVPRKEFAEEVRRRLQALSPRDRT